MAKHENMLTKERILEEENKLGAALMANDIFALESLLHDGMLTNNFEGHTHTKAMYMDEVRSGVLRISEYRTSDVVVSVVDDVGVVTLSVVVEGTMAGNVLAMELKVLRVWKELGDGVKVVGMSDASR